MIVVVSKQLNTRWLLVAVTQHGPRTNRHDHEFEGIGEVVGWLIEHAPRRAIVIAMAGRNQIEAVLGGPDMIIF